MDKVSGRMQMRFSSLQPWADLSVIDTDYEDYAIMYSCTNILGIYTTDFVWILMRQPWEIGTEYWNILSFKIKKIIMKKMGGEFQTNDFLMKN